MPRIYVGSSDIARKSKKIYVGVNNTARRCKKIYVGDSNNIARLCYVDLATNIECEGAVGDTVTFRYNGRDYYIYFPTFGTVGSLSEPLYLNEMTASITFTSTKTGWSTTQTINAGQSNTIKVYPSTALYWYGNICGNTFTFTKYEPSGIYAEYNYYSDHIYLGCWVSQGYVDYDGGAAVYWYKGSKSVSTLRFGGESSNNNEIIGYSGSQDWDELSSRGWHLDGIDHEVYISNPSGSYIYLGTAFWDGSHDSLYKKANIYAVY